MKKSTYFLALFVMLSSVGSTYAQSNIVVRAPVYVKTLPSSLPSEHFIKPYTNACYLLTATELAALTGSNINMIGLHLFFGQSNSVATGSINVYLQNTNDLSYTKGTNFPSCITGMSNVFSGPTTIAAISGSTDVTCSLISPFTYTGGGLYVAFSWTSGVSSSALYSYGYVSPSHGVIKGQTSLTPAINTMTATSWRPTFVFGLSNTATNEVGIDFLLAPGKVAESLHAKQIVKAIIRNMSISTLSNVPVTLNILGANSFTDTQVIPSLFPGAATTVSFTAHTPTALGSSTMMVSIPADQNIANNTVSWTQSVSCNQAGHGPPNVGYFEPTYFQGILAGKFNFDAASTMRLLRLAISSTGINDMVYGVLLDKNGTMIAYTNTMVVASGMPNTFQTFTFTPPRVLQANTNYYIGMAIQGANLSTLGIIRLTDGVPGARFGVLPLSGGIFNEGNPAYYGIEPVLSGTVEVSPSTSVICKDDELLLTPSGSTTYYWYNSSNNFLPSLANGSLLVLPLSDMSYTVKGTDAAGCSTQGSLFLKVEECTGFSENAGRSDAELYPNPTVNSKTSIHGLEGFNTIQVFNMFGQVVIETSSYEETVNLDMTGQAAGHYFVRITDSNRVSQSRKFIHQE